MKPVMIFFVMLVIFFVILFVWFFEAGELLETIRGTIDEVYILEGGG